MAISSANEVAQEHFYHAFVLWQDEDYESAAAEALLASKANKAPFPEAELLVAYSYANGEDFSGQDLIKQLEKIVKLDPADAGSWLLLALQARTVRDRLFAGAVERNNLTWHREADKYFKMSKKAFQEARNRFPAFARSQSHALSFLLSSDLPIRAGDYVAESDTMPIKDALDWYQTAIDYDTDAILSAIQKAGLYEDEEALTELRTEIEGIKTTALRKKTLLENSTAVKKKRNTAVERTLSQKVLINLAIVVLVILFLCWGLYALIT